MASSSVPLVKRTLITLLKARPALAGVQVEWTHPEDRIEKESMFFLTTELLEVSGQLSQGTRHETYTLNLWVVVHKDGNDPQATEERCWALVAEVEAQLRATPDLGITQPNVKSLTAQFAGAEQDNFAELEGWSSQVKCSVQIDARI